LFGHSGTSAGVLCSGRKTGPRAKASARASTDAGANTGTDTSTGAREGNRRETKIWRDTGNLSDNTGAFWPKVGKHLMTKLLSSKFGKAFASTISPQPAGGK